MPGVDDHDFPLKSEATPRKPDFIDLECGLADPEQDTEEMKRTHAKQLIERYFYQLSDGCGSANCTNQNCASSGAVKSLTPNQAAARAIQLFSEDAQLCDVHGARKIARSKSPPHGSFPKTGDNSDACGSTGDRPFNGKSIDR